MNKDKIVILVPEEFAGAVEVRYARRPGRPKSAHRPRQAAIEDRTDPVSDWIAERTEFCLGGRLFRSDALADFTAWIDGRMVRKFFPCGLPQALNHGLRSAGWEPGKYCGNRFWKNRALRD